MFYWVLGVSWLVGGGLIVVIKILWDRGNTAQDRAITALEKTSGLSEVERSNLRQLYDWHNKVDDDQVPLWYTPRSWSSLTKDLRDDYSDIKILLMRVVEQGDGVTSDLRQQLKERLVMHDHQQNKMIRLAIRVQQAVEALAGIETSTIEHDFDADDEVSGL